MVSEVRDSLYNSNNVKEFKIISIIDNKTKHKEENDVNVFEMVNHLDAFITYVKDNLEPSDIMLSELVEVCK